MSFAGGPGHKSPFAERAKATKPHLSPRRSSAANSGVGGSSRNAQQSLFGKESDSSAKVGQLRQPDVKEPTTPTRASEGSALKQGNRGDEFSYRRVRTPIKTPSRTAFGTVAPRSPKRPYMGSPKYQKVLLERPAFYNSPAAGEVPTLATESAGRKEVSISELQKRLKRFLQDENAPSPGQLEVTPCGHLDEVPYNISRSPRVNPLFHHDDTVLHVAKGGVAFTAGVSDTTSVQTRPGGVAFTAGVPDTISTHTRPGGVAFAAGEADTVSIHTPPDVNDLLPVVETSSPIPQCILDDEPASGADASCDEACEAQEQEQLLRSEDFPVHSEVEDGRQVEADGSQVEADGSQVEEECAEDVGFQPPSALAAPELGSNSELENPGMETLNSSIVEVQGSEGETSANETLEAHEDANAEAGAAQLETKADCISEVEEEEEEVIEVLESWSQRFLKFVVLAVVVACVMGFMVLTSGSQGLLPESLHSTSVTSPFGSSPLSSSVIPVSIGFMGMGREHEGMQCLPAVHLGLKCLSSTSNVGAIRHEDSSSSESYDTSSVTRKDSKLTGIDDVVDSEQLKTVTDYYKELQGRLFSDVASLTAETALSDASEAGTTSGMEDGQFPAMDIGVLDDVAEVAGTEDVTEVAATEVVSEVAAIQVFEELVATEDVSELVNEVAEELQLDTLPSSDECGREESEIAQNLKGLEQFIPDTTTELETHQLPADVKLDALSPVNQLFDNKHNVVPTTPIDTTDPISSVLRDSEMDSELEEVTFSVSLEESAFNDIQADSDEETSLINFPPVTEEVFTDENPTASPVPATDEDSISRSSLNVEDIVNDHDVHDEELQSQSTTEVGDSPDLESARDVACTNPESKVVVSEESAPHEEEVQVLYPLATIALLVTALALTASFMLKSQKSSTVPKTVTLASAIQAEAAVELNAFPGTATAQLKTMSSPVAWPATRSVYDSHIPDRDELDAITSPLRSIRTQRNYGLESFFTKFASAEPALSAPGLFQPRAKVEQRPATTWHPAMRAGSNTISSSGYRQTASYIPTIPSESGISTSTRGTSDMDSVCESVLTMGAEEWEHLGSFTTTEFVSVNEGGEEHKIRTPVRRSQRLRNKVSPLPVKFT